MKIKRVSFKVMVDDDCIQYIDYADAKVRTKAMIAFDKTVNASKIRNNDLLSKYGYENQDKAELKVLIEGPFFGCFETRADPNKLIKTTSVASLASLIFDSFIPDHRKK